VDDEGHGPRGGDGTRSTVEDLRGRVEPTDPPGDLGHEETVDPDASPLLAALFSLLVPGLGLVRAGLRTRGLYWLGGWLGVAFVGLVLTLFLVGVLILLVVPLIHVGAAVDSYRQVRRWRDEARPRVG
jgi:hypothetical protein